MHIPDGYLSPSTCAALYAAAMPFWHGALRRLRESVSGRAVPLVSLFAAFSFVMMMFNIPLPGATTGHATGVAVAAIVAGPWAATLAISLALAIQALLFGDGGLLALGANCLNIAVAGSFTAHFVFRALASASPSPRRRTWSAGLAGYAAINVAALLTAFELGLQPLLFTDASGAPLYSPYPLSIALPAMMIGHLTIAGLAEGILTASVLAWLVRAEPGLLEAASAPAAAAPRRLWAGLALLLLLTPLGLIAAGTAWGEWSAEEFASEPGRAEIARASLGAEPPERVPEGLARLSALWTAPLPDYAPPFMRSEVFGYLLSGMFGTGVVIAAALLLGWWMRRAREA